MGATAREHEAETATDPVRNEVILWGRLAVPPEERTLPSGDAIVTFRVVIPRREGARDSRRQGTGAKGARPGQVDTIDVVCWSAATRRAALRCQPGVNVEVEGSLRRRFFATPGGRQSRYEVEAKALRRLKDGAVSAT